MPDAFADTRLETLSQHLAAMRQRYPMAGPQWTAKATEAVLACVASQRLPQQLALIEDLSRTIANARTEFAALGTIGAMPQTEIGRLLASFG